MIKILFDLDWYNMASGPAKKKGHLAHRPRAAGHHP